MKKEMLASVLVLTFLVGATPIFAINHTNTKALNETQLAKLNQTQTKLNALVTKINGLLTKYKNTKHKGLLWSLIISKKKAQLLKAQIKYLIKYPTWNVNKKISILVKKAAHLEKQVNHTAKILNKTSTTPVKNCSVGNKTSDDKSPLTLFNKTKNNCNSSVKNTSS
jgi:hypothetical protein